MTTQILLSIFKPRALLFLLMVVCALAAFFPERALVLAQVNINETRAPQIALQAARWLLVLGAFVFGAMFVAWQWVRDTIVFFLHWILNIPDLWFWIGTIGLASLMRAIVAFGFPKETLENDAGWYYRAAQSLAMGNGLQVGGRLTAYRPPFYPLLLSLTQRLFGHAPEWAWFWGILATIILITTTFLISRQLYNIQIAKLATLAMAIYPALALMTGQTMSDVVFLAGLQLIVWFILSRATNRYAPSIIIGVALGLLTLTRSVAIGLFALVPIIWWLQNLPWKKLVLPCLVVTSTFVGTLAPWVWRNYVVLGVPTLGTNLGLMAYAGNHPGATGGGWLFDPPLSMRNTERRPSEAEFDSQLLNEAMAYALAHPLDILSVIPKKLLNQYLFEITAAQLLFQGTGVYPLWLKYGSYGVTQIAYLIVLVSFCFRVLDLGNSATRPRGTQWIGWLIILYFTFVYMLFLGNDRYRLPVLPWLIIESTVWLKRITQF